MVICVDFDGTVVEHKYPFDGEDVPHAVRVLKALVAKKHKIILYTMRDQLHLTRAQMWYKDKEIPLYGANRNPDQYWTTSPKVYAELYIDDAALGAPLIQPLDKSRPYVDWLKVEELLKERGIL